MKLALIKGDEVVEVFPDSKKEIDLPGGVPMQVSPLYAGWEGHGFKIVEVSEFVIPDGKHVSGDFSYEISNGAVIESAEVENIPAPPPLPSVSERLQALGFSDADKAAFRAWLGIA